MSRLDELLRELCPDGVEYVKIGDVVNFEQPSKYIVKSTDYNDEYPTPVLTAGQTFILGYTNEEDGHYKASKEQPVIIFDDFTGAFKWVDFEFKVKSSAMKMLTADESRTSLRYIYHIMGKIGLSSSEHKRLWIGVYSEFKIPLPPLKVQSEIVRILDNFTELTAELTARKKQSAYYKMQLLQAVEHSSEYDLSEICEIIDCPHTSPKWQDTGIPVIRNYNLVNGIIDTTRLSYVSEEDYKLRIKRAEPREDDILFSREAPIGNVGIVPANFQCCQGQRVVLLRPNKTKVYPQYLLHALQSDLVKKQISKVDGVGATVSNFNISDLRRLKICLPSIEEQKLISSKMDVFTKYCDAIMDGLPLEISLRQKQYAYYRDLLLSFKERIVS